MIKRMSSANKRRMLHQRWQESDRDMYLRLDIFLWCWLLFAVPVLFCFTFGG